MNKGGCVLINNDCTKIALVYRKWQKDFSFPKGHLEEGETLEKYILAIIEYCSDVESGFWDINEWKQLMFALYKTGCYTDDWYEGPIDMPSLKNVEKAAAFAKKHGLELSDDDDDANDD